MLGQVQELAAAPPCPEFERDRAALGAQITDSHRAFKSMVAECLGAEWAGRVKWACGPLPIISNLAGILRAEVFDSVDRARVLDDVSAPTALEQADCDWQLAVAQQVARARERACPLAHKSLHKFITAPWQAIDGLGSDPGGSGCGVSIKSNPPAAGKRGHVKFD